MKYKLYITYSQTIEREVEAKTEKEAESKGYEIGEEHCEIKTINIDVVVEKTE